MKWKSVALGAIALVAFAGIALLAARKGSATPAEKRDLETRKDKLSYAMGVAMAKSLERANGELDAEVVALGVKDALSGAQLLMSESDLRDTMGAAQAEAKQKEAAAAAETKKRGAAFLAENGKSEGVVTLTSGLQYKVLKAADGRKATEKDVVQCHYRGSHIDGTEFDNSYDRGQPATFQVARAIPGWKEALKLMSVGSKWTLFMPSQLAFGERGLRARSAKGRSIGANETVIFDLKLVAINSAARGAKASAGNSPAATREN
jgi:UDP-GlcNAc:undecaprenyl-phosphate/decaprenyl-phosphate GlcNAc-1-phosphate transferase